MNELTGQKDKVLDILQKTLDAVQAAMEEHLSGAAAAPSAPAVPEPAGTAAEVGVPFSDTDPGWIEVALDSLVTLFRGKADFATHNDLKDFMVAIPDKCSISLVSD